MPTRSAWPALMACSAVPTSRIRWPTRVGTPVAARTREADGTATASGPVESLTYLPRVPWVMLK